MLKKDLVIKIGVDAGNSFTNVVSDRGYYNVFDSCVVENVGGNQEDSDNTILIKERHFTIGQGDITAKTARERDINIYEALVNFAIAKNLEDRKLDLATINIKVHLGIGLPTEDYAELKESYKEFFNNATMNVKLKSGYYNYTITEVRVMPQGSILGHTNKELFADILNKGYLVDFGSLSIDVQEFSKGTIVKQNRKSYEDGVLTMVQDLVNPLKKLGVNVKTKKEVEQILIAEKVMTKNGWISMEDTEMEELRGIIEKRLDVLVEKIKFDFPAISMSEKTVIVGGGALLFKKYLKNAFLNTEFIDNPERVNADCYFKFIGGK